MNLVLDDAEEVNIKKKSRKTLGMLQFLKFCSMCVFRSCISEDFFFLIREDPS